MPMTTRCPRCGTAFKVVADQLRVRNGLVRCGVCSHVFDGFAAIVDDQPPTAPADPSPPHRSAPAHARPGTEASSPVLSLPADRPSPYGAPIPMRPSAEAAESRPPADAVQPAAPPVHVPVQPYRPPVPPAYPQHSWQSPVPAQEPEPYKPELYQPDPQAPDLHKPGPYKPEPYKPEPYQPGPYKPGPYEAEPYQAEPYQAEPYQAEPYDQPAADAPPSRPLLSPIDTEALRPVVPPPSYPEPVPRQAPRAPYIPAVHQSQPQPHVPSRQGTGPYAVRVAEPPVFTPAPAVLRGRGNTHRHEPTVSSGERPDDGAAADHVDDQVFLPDSDDEGRDHYVSHVRLDVDEAAPHGRDGGGADSRYSIYVDPDRQDDETAYLPIPGEARTRYDDAVDAGMAPPQFMDESAQRRIVIIRRLWGYGCLLGLILLGVQWVYVYRTAIVAAVPALRPALQSACDSLGCQVGYARRIERISITASSLQPPANAGNAAEGGPSRLVLAVTMRNRYDKPQPWPALVLQLTDLSDTVVVRKVLRPEDYLPAGAPGAFAAGGEQSVSVPIQVSGVQVNGYQLDKFFP